MITVERRCRMTDRTIIRTGVSASGHPFRADQDHPITYWQTMEIAVRELLIEKGVATASEIADQIAAMDARGPALGATSRGKGLVRPRLQGAPARRRVRGLPGDRDRGRGAKAGRRREHRRGAQPYRLHFVFLLPAQFARVAARLVQATRLPLPRRARTACGAGSEFGVALEPGVAVRVHDSTADMRYLVLPPPDRRRRRAWSEDRLASLVTRDSMIGVGLAKDATAVEALNAGPNPSQSVRLPPRSVSSDSTRRTLQIYRSNRMIFGASAGENVRFCDPFIHPTFTTIVTVAACIVGRIKFRHLGAFVRCADPLRSPL